MEGKYDDPAVCTIFQFACGTYVPDSFRCLHCMTVTTVIEGGLYYSIGRLCLPPSTVVLF